MSTRILWGRGDVAAQIPDTMRSRSQVLIVAPDSELSHSLRFALEAEGFGVTWRTNISSHPMPGEFACTIVDHHALGDDRAEAQRFVRAFAPVVLLANSMHPLSALVFRTVVTAAVTTLQTPVTFLASLQSGDLLRAIGAAAASVTGPTNAAAQAAILADGARVAPRALNAFQVGVVGHGSAPSDRWAWHQPSHHDRVSRRPDPAALNDAAYRVDPT